MHEEQCAYTFLVPRDSIESCVRTTSQVESEKMIVDLHREGEWHRNQMTSHEVSHEVIEKIAC